MLPPISLIASLISGSDIKDVLPFSASVVTALLAWFAARSTSLARLQKTLLDASRDWVRHTQEQRALDIARISELEAELLKATAEALRLRGEVDAGIQRDA